MKFLSSSLLLVVFSIFLASCGSAPQKNNGKERSSGKTAELIIATPGEITWEGEVGDSLRSFFDQDFEVLPQYEPIFEYAHLPIAKLEDSRMFRAHHNILIVEFDKNLKEPVLEARKDFWSAPQRVINIKTATKAEFIPFFEQKKEVIYKILMDSEYERLNRTFTAFRDRNIMNEILNNFGFTVTIPSGFYVATKKLDFMWIRKETQNNSQGLMIYTYDFQDTLAFDQQRIISYRDVITQEFVPGPTEGSYMVVAQDYAPVYSTAIDLKGLYAVETRSLWRLENDFMGGPFVSYTFVDESRQKVVTIDGYVYAPNKPKRDLLIQMEAIAHSLKFESKKVN